MGNPQAVHKSDLKSAQCKTTTDDKKIYVCKETQINQETNNTRTTERNIGTYSVLYWKEHEKHNDDD